MYFHALSYPLVACIVCSPTLFFLFVQIRSIDRIIHTLEETVAGSTRKDESIEKEIISLKMEKARLCAGDLTGL